MPSAASAFRKVAPRDDALLFGYGRIEAAQMDDAIRRLSRCLG